MKKVSVNTYHDFVFGEGIPEPADLPHITHTHKLRKFCELSLRKRSIQMPFS